MLSAFDIQNSEQQKMIGLFEEERVFQRMLDVEAALARAEAEVGDIPRMDAEEISRKAYTSIVQPERIRNIEAKTHHLTHSVVLALAEQCGPSGKYVHLAATSSDIMDTAMALILKDAIALIETKLVCLHRIFQKHTKKYKNHSGDFLVHRQTLLSATLGPLFEACAPEVEGHIQRIRQCKERIIVGKMSGAVGTQAAFGQNAERIQRIVMKELGLHAAEIATQNVQRDRYAELFCVFALIASSIEKLSAEIASLLKPEKSSPFKNCEDRIKTGKSTLPHNTLLAMIEKISEMAKIVRSAVIPSLENMVTWHERDLTQSSAERFLNPLTCILTYNILILMLDLMYSIS